jgi:hypothetical protein
MTVPTNDTTDKKLTPKERAAQKQREKISALTGVQFEGELGAQLAGAVDDMLRTGLRQVDPDEEMALECGSEYHMARFSGPGATLAPLLYSVSMRVGGKSGDFFPSLKKMGRYLNVTDDDALYGAASLLEASGFWERIEAPLGKPVKYRPVPHSEWELNHPGFCTRKTEFPFRDDDTLAKLGTALYGVLGEEFFPNVLKGWRKFGTDEQLVEYAKEFLVQDAGQENGAARRIRFGQYLRSKVVAK